MRADQLLVTAVLVFLGMAPEDTQGEEFFRCDFDGGNICDITRTGPKDFRWKRRYSGKRNPTPGNVRSLMAVGTSHSSSQWTNYSLPHYARGQLNCLTFNYVVEANTGMRVLVQMQPGSRSLFQKEASSVDDTWARAKVSIPAAEDGDSVDILGIKDAGATGILGVDDVVYIGGPCNCADNLYLVPGTRDDSGTAQGFYAVSSRSANVHVEFRSSIFKTLELIPYRTELVTVEPPGDAGALLYRSEADNKLIGYCRECRQRFPLYSERELSTHYVISHFRPYTLTQPSSRSYFVDIVIMPVHDNTTGTVGYYPDEPAWNFKLNRFEAWSYANATSQVGVEVKANKPIAVFVREVRKIAKYGSTSTMNQAQMEGIERWSKTLIVPPPFRPELFTERRIRIVSATDSTKVSVIGVSNVTLTRLEYADIDLPVTGFIIVQATHPIQVVVEYVYINTAVVSWMVLPSTSKMESTVTLESVETKYQLVLNAGKESTVQVRSKDGTWVPKDNLIWSPFPSNSNLLSTKFDNSEGYTALRAEPSEVFLVYQGDVPLQFRASPCRR